MAAVILQTLSENFPPFAIKVSNEAVVKEILFDAYLYRKTWTVIHVIELEDLSKRGTQIQGKLAEIKKFCQQMSRNKNEHEKSICTKITAIDLLYKRLQ